MTPAPELVTVAHGSRSAAATAATRALVAAVRRRRPALTVRESYLDHGEPRLEAVLARAVGPRVVVPLLLGAAYHSEVDVPAIVAGAGGPVVRSDVLGPDPLLLRGLERRLAAAGVVVGDPATAVVLAAAGSTGAESTGAVRSLARGWAGRGWWAVRPAYASAAGPTVRDAVADLRREGAPRVVVASYLLFPGLFADRLAAAGADVTSAPLADAPEVVEVVLARYGAAAACLPAAAG